MSAWLGRSLYSATISVTSDLTALIQAMNVEGFLKKSTASPTNEVGVDSSNKAAVQLPAKIPVDPASIQSLQEVRVVRGDVLGQGTRENPARKGVLGR